MRTADEMGLLLGGYADEYPPLERWTIPPNLRLKDGKLCYDPAPRDPDEWQWTKRPNGRLLWEFVELAEAGDKTILAFAKRWGVLALCSHEIPVRRRDRLACYSHFQCCRAAWREPLRAWRYYAKSIRDLLEIIRRDRNDPAKVPEIAEAVNWFATDWGHLRPVLMATEAGAMTLRLSGSYYGMGLPAVISYQLMLFAAGVKGFYQCASCGNWFEPRQGQNLTKHNYCSGCGRAAAQRRASKRYYEQRKLRQVNNGTTPA
jgi:hypothetical protein